MLSYQHSYHAGNMADVHKHAMLAWMLDYMTAKPKPLSYMETHAGRALYDLSGPEALKTGEAARGIALADRWFPADHPYMRALRATRDRHGPQAYPGSPQIAMDLLRFEDSIALSELHPAEVEALRAALPGVTVSQTDGYAGALSRCPPDPRRGLLLCDPSWEIKSDYETVPDFMAKLHRKWAVGVLVLWFPVLEGAPHRPMVRQLHRQFPDAISHTVAFPPARPGHGMTGSGLFVVNPPYGFVDQANWLSDKFATLCAQP
ncbi:23S rRNA (adenine2030-N6)-methyltransferase [Loktanella sp. DSM 29012]|uniref:Ribosomal RNA large subunit methyltransferase J n=1 Tax=Loktanella gaetbuli TaxID=2881335 RepID=A0ABS8BVG0_9RHOB|nr:MULTISPECIES: 23S rRNA (adenine(2030)-N(6))-methyltransferase RlmJ [Loktanella]MCB5199721.1 23S rRNA (adenine(2030)-N(6))-methyltransferase RlmJ [Loktanella gaetbuli]SEP99242.1 23S rRNA (adenine2030-N6)-methyltransferase [Loktanella sp. DSM 29012]